MTEIKRLESPDLTFTTKKKAEEHALKLCRTWIDEQKAGVESRVTQSLATSVET